jgi:hypothetical protein
MRAAHSRIAGTASAVVGFADPGVTPNSDGLPGLSVVKMMVGSLLTWGLVACVAGLVLAVIVWAVAHHPRATTPMRPRARPVFWSRSAGPSSSAGRTRSSRSSPTSDPGSDVPTAALDPCVVPINPACIAQQVTGTVQTSARRDRDQPGPQCRPPAHDEEDDPCPRPGRARSGAGGSPRLEGGRRR